MDHLLFLAHRIPYPPNKGDKIRSYHILEFLSRHYRVHLAAFIDQPDDWPYRSALEPLCASAWFGRLSPAWAKWRSLGGLATGAPLSLPYYRRRALAIWIRAQLRRHDIRRVFVFSSAMAQYVLERPFAATRRVIDFVDVDSDKWRQYAETTRFPLNWIYRREATRLGRFETRVASVCDASLLVSEPEAELLRRQLPPAAAVTVHAVRNGVDSAYFQPSASRASPFRGDAPRIVFTGAMDYWANAEGAIWFVDTILPRVRTAHPGCEFHIVGMNPSPAVRQLARQPGVVVTGAVPDIRPYLQHATLVAVPLRIARGIQNKVLEAMAMGQTVVTTPQALEGIPARVGEEVLLAATSDDFAARIEGFLDRRDPTPGARARALIEREFDWERSLPRILELLEPDSI